MNIHEQIKILSTKNVWNKHKLVAVWDGSHLCIAISGTQFMTLPHFMILLGIIKSNTSTYTASYVHPLISRRFALR
jgi:hypothetical protein